MKLLSKIKSLVLNLDFFLYSISVLIGALICLFNYEKLLSYQKFGGFSSASLYEVIFVNLVLSSAFLLKVTLPRSMSSNSTMLTDFFEINDNKKPITFSVFVNFLSEQALGAFLATVVVITGKDIITDYGVVLGAIYTFLMYVLIILIMTISLVKLISFFVKRRKREYFLACSVSALVLFSFFRLGLAMA
ncbi:hypothetical protein NL53_20440 [Vibrio variabilis]|uniref:Uncharacterized protein n=1 Tax=Vibrio variabilis TaxID=990271 RepID=A0ABR4Y5E1_9VIBR|nr:hypothetical protein [Vibrio variabilis]KHA58703.1 hypothetical protein NL53_20440 [Vibrio variabilis]